MSPLTMVLIAMFGLTTAQATQATEFVRVGARASGQSEAIVAATFKDESNFNPKARSPVGALGVGQLYKSNTYWKPWRKHCVRHPKACAIKGAEYAGLALRDAVERCGTVERGLTAYRAGYLKGGRCKPAGRKALKTVALSRRIAWRVHMEIHKALLPLALP